MAGFAPVVLLVIVAFLGAAGFGTATAANQSSAGDILFGLDKAIENLRVVLATNDQAKVKLRLEIARERLEELEEAVEANEPIDEVLVEAQDAITTATSTLSTVEVSFKKNQIRLSSTDLQALLTELHKILLEHQGLIRKIDIKVKHGEIKVKIKLFKKEASESAELIEDDLDDLKDDGELNDSDEDDD